MSTVKPSVLYTVLTAALSAFIPILFTLSELPLLPELFILCELLSAFLLSGFFSSEISDFLPEAFKSSSSRKSSNFFPAFPGRFPSNLVKRNLIEPSSYREVTFVWLVSLSSPSYTQTCDASPSLPLFTGTATHIGSIFLGYLYSFSRFKLIMCLPPLLLSYSSSIY